MTPLEHPADPVILTSENGTFSEPRSGGLALAGPTIPERFAPLVERAEELAEASQAPGTVRAYESDWRQFVAWCGAAGFSPLPAAPEVVCLYLTDVAGLLATGTISRRLTVIRRRHADAGHDNPTAAVLVQRVWEGIRRTQGTAQNGKAPAITDVLRAMVATLDLERLIGLRDRALLVLGFAGALRRSELVALDIGDVREDGKGLVVHLDRSKTDQRGAGHDVGLPYGSDPLTCPVRAHRDWTAASGLEVGPLFWPINRHGHLGSRRLSDRAVALVVKRTAKAAGYDPVDYAAHSLRAGLATAAAEADVLERDIMRHGRWRSTAVMRRYIRGAQLFKDNAAAAVGL